MEFFTTFEARVLLYITLGGIGLLIYYTSRKTEVKNPAPLYGVATYISLSPLVIIARLEIISITTLLVEYLVVVAACFIVYIFTRELLHDIRLELNRNRN